jgi:hypothetical protein
MVAGPNRVFDPLKEFWLNCTIPCTGNFYRIRSAFDFGARKLGKILQVPVCSTVIEVNQFFRNTLKRNCTGLRPDISVSSSDDGLITDHATNDSLSLGLNVHLYIAIPMVICLRSLVTLIFQILTIMA